MFTDMTIETRYDNLQDLSDQEKKLLQRIRDIKTELKTVQNEIDRIPKEERFRKPLDGCCNKRYWLDSDLDSFRSELAELAFKLGRFSPTTPICPDCRDYFGMDPCEHWVTHIYHDCRHPMH